MSKMTETEIKAYINNEMQQNLGKEFLWSAGEYATVKLVTKLAPKMQTHDIARLMIIYRHMQNGNISSGFFDVFDSFQMKSCPCKKMIGNIFSSAQVVPELVKFGTSVQIAYDENKDGMVSPETIASLLSPILSITGTVLGATLSFFGAFLRTCIQ